MFGAQTPVMTWGIWLHSRSQELVLTLQAPSSSHPSLHRRVPSRLCAPCITSSGELIPQRVTSSRASFIHPPTRWLCPWFGCSALLCSGCAVFWGNLSQSQRPLPSSFPCHQICPSSPAMMSPGCSAGKSNSPHPQI